MTLSSIEGGERGIQFHGIYADDDSESFRVPRYELNGGTMYINDPVWGEDVIGSGDSPFGELLIKLARHPVMRRTQAIEQLSLGSDFATMPNTAHFSRWSHIWGSLVFVRKMNKGRDISDRENEVMQLRTLLSDVGHTAFSHVGDWLFQEGNNKEDLHDQELKSILRISGIEDLLESYGFSLDELVFPDVEDWVERPAPDLCVDRVDYGLREMIRWQGPITGIDLYAEKMRDPQSLFAIVEGQLTIKDPDFASRFAAGYSLLSTEHWSHPVHRLQLRLFQLAIRRILAESRITTNNHPRDSLYLIDTNFQQDLATSDVPTIIDKMRSIALSQRAIFGASKSDYLTNVFGPLSSGAKIDKDYVFPNFPDPLSPQGMELGETSLSYPAGLVIEESSDVDVDPVSVTADGLKFVLPSLKPRMIDPYLFDEEGLQQRLSDYNPSYLKFTEGQRSEMAKKYSATIMMPSDSAREILLKDKEARKSWDRITRRRRLPETLESEIMHGGAWGGAMRFDDITDW